jgi:hypothetical protein
MGGPRKPALLAPRLRRMILALADTRERAGFLTNWQLFATMDWQAQSRALYTAAAEVAAKLGG